MANTKRRRDGRIRRTMRYTDPVTGESRKHEVYGKTRREAAQKLKEARDRVDAGAPVRDSSRTLAEWSKQWRETSLQASERRGPTNVDAAVIALSRNHVEAGTSATFGSIASVSLTLNASSLLCGPSRFRRARSRASSKC